MSQSTAVPAIPLDVLSYASAAVHSAPPRTVSRVVLDTAKKALGMMLTGVRAVILLAGYAVLGAGIALRLAFSVVAMVLLFVGGLRWELVKSRTLRAAEWVDQRTLATVAFLRRPFHSRLRGGNLR